MHNDNLIRVVPRIPDVIMSQSVRAAGKCTFSTCWFYTEAPLANG